MKNGHSGGVTIVGTKLSSASLGWSLDLPLSVHLLSFIA